MAKAGAANRLNRPLSSRIKGKKYGLEVPLIRIKLILAESFEEQGSCSVSIVKVHDQLNPNVTIG